MDVISAANFSARFDRPMWAPEPTIKFAERGKTYTVDTHPVNPPEFQMEPDVCYWRPLPFIAIAEDLEDDEEVFYEIFTKSGVWVQVDTKMGKSIMNMYEISCKESMNNN
jgi:hypothetical protein